MSTPTPRALAEQLRALADRLDKHGREVAAAAPLLAARGFAAGGGGPRGNSEDTSTEAAALNPHEFADIDERWRRLLRSSWALTTGGIHLVDQVLAHADPKSTERAVVRAGSGICGACLRDVPGTPGDRLRSGWCDACRKAWERADRPDRMAFQRTRYAELHPPETVTVDPADPAAA